MKKTYQTPVSDLILFSEAEIRTIPFQSLEQNGAQTNFEELF